jgi:hypothetical protein
VIALSTRLNIGSDSSTATAGPNWYAV